MVKSLFPYYLLEERDNGREENECYLTKTNCRKFLCINSIKLPDYAATTATNTTSIHFYINMQTQYLPSKQRRKNFRFILNFLSKIALVRKKTRRDQLTFMIALYLSATTSQY